MIDGYAPQSNKATEETYSFYTELEELVGRFKRTHIVIMLGYFNARLQYRPGNEKEVIGPYVFGRGERHLHSNKPNNY